MYTQCVLSGASTSTHSVLAVLTRVRPPAFRCRVYNFPPLLLYQVYNCTQSYSLHYCKEKKNLNNRRIKYDYLFFFFFCSFYTTATFDVGKYFLIIVLQSQTSASRITPITMDNFQQARTFAFLVAKKFVATGSLLRDDVSAICTVRNAFSQISHSILMLEKKVSSKTYRAPKNTRIVSHKEFLFDAWFRRYSKVKKEDLEFHSKPYFLTPSL